MLHFPCFDLYREQADPVPATHTCTAFFEEVSGEEQIVRDFACYEPLTVRDSSLSARVQAVLAARTGHLDPVHAHTAEAALTDLADLEHSARDGLHIAFLAGTRTAPVAGFGGMRRDDSSLRSVPRLSSRLRRPASALRFLGRRPRVEATADRATRRLRSGAPLTVRQHGAGPTVREGAPVERPPPVPRPRPAPEQPPHRGPHPR